MLVSPIQHYNYANKAQSGQLKNANASGSVQFKGAKGRALGIGLGTAITLGVGFCFPPGAIAVTAYLAHKCSKWEDEENAEKARENNNKK